MDYSDLYFVVGSPRSGTKIFRDTLEAHPAVTATDHPLEEIWTTGQEDADHEAYSPDSLTPEIVESIREAFAPRIERSEIFVEKNVRNSLRIPYIREVFPGAKFIHIIRNPLDVIVSLRKRWQNPIDWSYYLSSNALQLSPRDIIYYSLKLGWKFIRRLLKGEKHVDTWGPIYPGLRSDLKARSLLEVCALQWKHCVSEARQPGQTEGGNYFEFNYECLMDKPGEVLEPLSDFLGVPSAQPLISFGTKNYRTTSIGRGQETLSGEELKTVRSVLQNFPSKVGYDTPEI